MKTCNDCRYFNYEDTLSYCFYKPPRILEDRTTMRPRILANSPICSKFKPGVYVACEVRESELHMLEEKEY
jgi:hypothetical protein